MTIETQQEEEFMYRQGLLSMTKDFSDPNTWLDMAEKAEHEGLLHMRDDFLNRAVEFEDYPVEFEDTNPAPET